MNPKVSIVVPIYNIEKYLPNCIESILSQTYTNIEIILVDDGSTDQSYNIIQKYAKKDHRIIVVRQQNSGQSSARNTGLQKASGDFISFVDGDDEISPHFIESLLNPFLKSKSQKTALSVCGIHYKRLRENSVKDVFIKPLRPKREHETFKSYILYLLATDGRMYSSVNKLYRTNAAKSIAFDEKLNFAEDTKFVLDYLNVAKGDISFILKPLYIYNFGTDTSTINSTAILWKNWQNSYQNLKIWLGKNPTNTEKLLLHLVRLRWRISYIRSKHRAKQ